MTTRAFDLVYGGLSPQLLSDSPMEVPMRSVSLKQVASLLLLVTLQIPSVVHSAARVPQAESEVQRGPLLVPEDRHADSLLSLRDLALLAPEPPPGTGPPHMKPFMRRTPPTMGSQSRSSTLPSPTGVQSATALVSSLLLPSPTIFQFPGLSNIDNTWPPDANLFVGATQLVQTVNTLYKIFDKSGKVLSGPSEISSLWIGFQGDCDPTYNRPTLTHQYTDPVILYDKLAGRWLITELASTDNNFNTSTECVAVSSTTDATGFYHLYSYSFLNLADYPKFGVWPDGYYASYNRFVNATGPFIGAQVCAYDRTNMLTGAATSPMQCFPQTAPTTVCTLEDPKHSFLPSDLDGVNPPPVGRPNFVMELGPLYDSQCVCAGNHLYLYKFHVDFAAPSNSTFSGPVQLLVAGFCEACYPTGTDPCIPQKGTTQVLDSVGDRLMHRLAYRNFGDHESLVANHTNWGGFQTTGIAHTSVKWYEIRDPNDVVNESLAYQAGTMFTDTDARWM